MVGSLENFLGELDWSFVRNCFRITISFNVNHTVDTENEPEIDPREDKPDIGEMKSKPNFDIDINRGTQTLSFTCSFNSEPGASGADDAYSKYQFGIDIGALSKALSTEWYSSIFILIIYLW